MSEITTVGQSVQGGVETVPGTRVPANLRFQSLGFDIGIMADIKKYTPKGAKYPSLAVKGKEWTDVALTGEITYTEAPVPLAMALGKPLVTPLDSGAAFQYDFESKTYKPDTLLTLTLEQGSSVRAKRVTNATLDKLHFKWSRDSATAEISGDLFANPLEDGVQLTGAGSNEKQTLTAGGSTAGVVTFTGNGQTVDVAYPTTADGVGEALETLYGSGNVIVSGPDGFGPFVVEFAGTLAGTTPALLTATSTGSAVTIAQTTAATVGVEPTLFDLVPATAEHVAVYADDLSSSFGTTLLERVLDVEILIGNRQGPLWALNRFLKGFAATVEKASDFEVKLLVEADEDGMALGLGTMRKGATKYIRVEAVGDPIVGSTHNSSITFDLPMKVAAIAKEKDQGGVFAYEITFTVVHDKAFGRSNKVSVVTGQRSI